MKLSKYILIQLIALNIHSSAFTHDITFCGEHIPVEDQAVSQKLMNIIRQQMKFGVVSLLRSKWIFQLKTIESVLRKYNFPEDFKYLPIIESGFNSDAESAVGAKGLWQLMPDVARALGLTINGEVDERTDPALATAAACKLLAQDYFGFQKTFGFSSWTLTAAAYNVGRPSITKSIKKQGSNNYWVMNLNKETSDYIYKMVAIKELFEYPELYMGNFGFNVFNNNAGNALAWNSNKNGSATALPTIQLAINTKDGNHPETEKELEKRKLKTDELLEDPSKFKFIGGQVKGDYVNFKDGDAIYIELREDLSINGGYKSKGVQIKGHGWLVDGKVFVDLGFGKKLIVVDPVKQVHDGVGLESIRNCTMAKGIPIYMKQALD
jgi:hypothetical protein